MKNSSRLVLILVSVAIGVIIAFGWMMFEAKKNFNDSFAELNQSLEKSTEKFSQKNKVTRASLELLIQLDSLQGVDPEKAREIRESFELIKTHVEQLSAKIKVHEEQMSEIAEWDSETHEYNNIAEMQKNGKYWLGSDESENDGRGNGAAITFHQDLIHHFTALESIRNKGLEPLEEESIRDTNPFLAESGPETWEQMIFSQKPVIANLAILEKLSLDLFELEGECLTILQQQAGKVFPKETVEPIP